MDTNHIRFLPLEFVENELSIKEPYLQSVLEYLNKNKINFKYIEAKVLIPTSNMKEKDLDNIIEKIKVCRAKNLEKGIKKHYL